ncbi:putative HAUS augmin-like complex subunit 6 [Helianthus anomalus]
MQCLISELESQGTIPRSNSGVSLATCYGQSGTFETQAYLQQELEKLHDLGNKVKMERELWAKLVSSLSQNSHRFQRATRLWDYLVSRESK